MAAVFVLVVGARFLLPLLIPIFPLPAILACLLLDGVDQTIFQAFGQDPPGYQSYDKAMDVYYLAIAYLATLRNWVSTPAFEVGRFLYFYRLVGVVAFESTQVRALLLVFPNTFEYFFIAYEAFRTRWNPLRLLLAGWIAVAAAIWILVKLPQEWWIHIAKLDLTDVLGEYAWAPWLLAALVALVLGVVRFVVLPRMPPADTPLRLPADPLPEEIDEAREVARWTAQHGRVWSWVTLEKVVLVGLLAVVFGNLLPGMDASAPEVVASMAVLVVANAAISIAASRRSVSIESLAVAFVVRLLVNAGVVLVSRWIFGPSAIDETAMAFFLFLLSLLTTLHDRWLPVREYRRAAAVPA